MKEFFCKSSRQLKFILKAPIETIKNFLKQINYKKVK